MYYLNKPFFMLNMSILIMSTMMAMSSTNWLFLWISMEVNMLSFIPLMMHTKNNQETEAAVKYFMAQALGSSLMLMTSFTFWSINNSMYLTMILTSAILLKLGMVPFHFWFPPVMTSLSWFSCTMLTTWQKLAPLIILSVTLNNTNLTFITLISSINALWGGMMGMNQSHLRTIMAYSSITHMGWMTSMLSISKPYLTMIYYIMYSSIIIPLFIIINKTNQYSNNQFNKMNIMAPILQLMIPIMLLSLSGMPPLTGFIPKWLIISSLAEKMPLMLVFLILGSMMNLYFYMNILFNSVMSMNYSSMNSAMNKIPMKSWSIIATMSISMLPLFLMYALNIFY